MLEQITFIRDRVKLHDSSKTACYSRMVASVFLIPFYMRLLLCGFETINLPITVGTWQFLIYGILIATYWYICRIRMWSHSFMINYIHAALNNRGNYCPRCFSRMKDENEIYFYDEKVGEEIHTVYYSNGWSDTYVEDVCIKLSEELPIYQCANRECHLQTRARTSSAHSSQVRNQIKEYYSFYEMPRTFKNTFRLIAGDLDHAYTESIATHFHSNTHHTILIIFSVILGIFSALEEFDILSYVGLRLLGSSVNIIAYGLMVALLLAGYFYIQAYIKKKCAEISVSHEYISKYKELDEYCADVFWAKHQSYAVLRNRRKAFKKARKENDPSISELKKYHYSSENKLIHDKLNYAHDSFYAICDLLPDMGFVYEAAYVNGCYVVDAKTENSPGKTYKIYVNCENGYTMFSLSVLCKYPHMFRDRIIRRWEMKTGQDLDEFNCYACEDRVVISFTVPCVQTYEFTVEEREALKWRFEEFYDFTKNLGFNNLP